MKKDDKIAQLLKEHGKQPPPSLDFTEMVMAQIKEETTAELDVVRTFVSAQKEDFIHSPSFTFESELFEKIAEQNTKAKVRPVFSQKSLIGMIVSVVLVSIIYAFFAQNTDSQYFDYRIFNQMFERSNSTFIVLTAIIVGGGMYVFDYLLRERLTFKL